MIRSWTGGSVFAVEEKRKKIYQRNSMNSFAVDLHRGNFTEIQQTVVRFLSVDRFYIFHCERVKCVVSKDGRKRHDRKFIHCRAKKSLIAKFRIIYVVKSLFNIRNRARDVLTMTVPSTRHASPHSLAFSRNLEACPLRRQNLTRLH